MKKKPIYISDLHFEHTLWSSQLAFQIDELKIFTRRLEEVVQRWTDKEINARIEQFQNQFIRHKEVLDSLLHEITVHNDELVKFAKEHPIALDHVHFEDHTTLRNGIDTQNEMYTNLKKEFMRFLTETM